MPVNVVGPAEGQSVNVTTPSGTGVVSNQYAKQNLLAKNVRGDFKMNARNSMVCDRSFQSEWGRELTEHGDTMSIRRLQMFQPQTGIDWLPQPNLEEIFTLHVETPVGVQTEEEWNTAGVWKSKMYSEASDVAKRQNLTYETDLACSRAFARGYMGHLTNGRYKGSRDAPSEFELVPAGHESDADDDWAGRYPDNAILSDARAELMQRGVQGRTLVALLDDYTSASLGRTALFRQQYGVGGAGAAAQARGSIDGQMVAGWKVMDSSLNGVCDFGDNWGNVTNREVTAPADEHIILNAVGTRAAPQSAHEFPEGLRVGFEDINAVNTRTKMSARMQAQYPVQSRVLAGGTVDAQAQPMLGPVGRGIRVGWLATGTGATAANRLASQTAFRQRNHDYTPAASVTNQGGAPTTNIPADRQVYLNDLDTSVAEYRNTTDRRGASGARTTRSWLLAQNSTVLIYANPHVPSGAGADVKKYTFAESKLEYCIGINTELRRKSTAYEIWTRFALGTVEYEAGFQVTGARLN